jgi:hypothetical protein
MLPNVVKPTRVTSLQQSREFVTTTNLRAVNYGKNVGPDLRVDPIGDGRDRRPRSSGTLVRGPRFLTDELLANKWPRSRGWGRGRRSGPCSLLGTRAAPILLPSRSQQCDFFVTTPLYFATKAPGLRAFCIAKAAVKHVTGPKHPYPAL